MPSMRKAFDGILRQYGHNIYLQRVMDPFNGDKITYKSQLEKHTVRYHSGSLGSLGSVAQEMPEGNKYDFDILYYFRHNVNPISGDRIYDNIEGYPNNTLIYIIDYVTPLRGEHGEIVYWAAGASREVPV